MILLYQQGTNYYTTLAEKSINEFNLDELIKKQKRVNEHNGNSTPYNAQTVGGVTFDKADNFY